jgi:hypothetical protein
MDVCSTHYAPPLSKPTRNEEQEVVKLIKRGIFQHAETFSAFYHRMARRHGKHKAIAALAHKVLVVIYHILRTKKPYTDLGADYFDQRDRKRIELHHIHRLEQLGYTVTLHQREIA